MIRFLSVQVVDPRYKRPHKKHNDLPLRAGHDETTRPGSLALITAPSLPEQPSSQPATYVTKAQIMFPKLATPDFTFKSLQF